MKTLDLFDGDILEVEKEKQAPKGGIINQKDRGGCTHDKDGKGRI